jgi:K+-sensing histidine kinase KdpD
VDEDRALARAHRRAVFGGALAAQAQRQQQAESALGATSAARNAVGQALLLAGASDDPALVAAAIAEAQGVLGAMEERVLELTDGDTAADAALDQALTDASDILEALAAGDLENADQAATNQLTASFSSMVDELVALRDGSAGEIRAAAAQSGTVATASRFMVAFLVPTIAMAVAFIMSRRQRKRDRLAAELQHERAVNKSKDQLIANLSHELRTPLTGIYTSALTMADIGDTEPELTQELTEVIIDQSSDLTRMVEDLLVSAQADAGRLRFDLRPTRVADLVNSMQAEFNRFESLIDYSVADAELSIDPGRFRQLLRNLVSNAAKYGESAVSIRGFTEKARFQLEIIDDGPGVPEDVAERMFERFVHRGDQPLIVGSVGLGLAISKVLVNGMNGSIWYERRGDTTVFGVDFPLLELPDPHPLESPELLDDEEQPQSAPVETLMLDHAVTQLLEAAGIATVGQLATTPTTELLAIHGIGQGRLNQIEASLGRSD